MAIGGGLSIFALVAAMLGLFGSQVIPKVVRLDALNYFNYTTIISMFDVVSIMDGTVTFIWKFQAAATIRSNRVPDAYHGKGVRYAGEQLSLKEGKKV